MPNLSYRSDWEGNATACILVRGEGDTPMPNILYSSSKVWFMACLICMQSDERFQGLNDMAVMGMRGWDGKYSSERCAILYSDSAWIGSSVSYLSHKQTMWWHCIMAKSDGHSQPSSSFWKQVRLLLCPWSREVFMLCWLNHMITVVMAVDKLWEWMTRQHGPVWFGYGHDAGYSPLYEPDVWHSSCLAMACERG